MTPRRSRGRRVAQAACGTLVLILAARGASPAEPGAAGQAGPVTASPVQTTGIAGVYMTQIFPFADSGSLPTFYNFEKAVYDSLK